MLIVGVLRKSRDDTPMAGPIRSAVLSTTANAGGYYQPRMEFRQWLHT